MGSEPRPPLGVCPDCGQRVRMWGSGTLRAHRSPDGKCPGRVPVEVIVRKPRPARRATYSLGTRSESREYGDGRTTSAGLPTLGRRAR